RDDLLGTVRRSLSVASLPRLRGRVRVGALSTNVAFVVSTPTRRRCAAATSPASGGGISMSAFTNLGDLIRRERDLDKVALIDLGGEQPPREFSYRQLDEMANGVARALLKRGL